MREEATPHSERVCNGQTGRRASARAGKGWTYQCVGHLLRKIEERLIVLLHYALEVVSLDHHYLEKSKKSGSVPRR